MRKFALPVLGLVALFDLSCSDASGPGNQANGRISITNDAGVLASRVTYLSDTPGFRTVRRQQGDSGVRVLNASTGTALGSVPRPNPDSLGLSPSVVVTNSVTIDQDLMFISNGEAGVYLAQGSQVFSATGAGVLPAITMLGKLRFGSLQSVNHVAYSAGGPGNPGVLIVAAGLGGLKIVQVN